MAVRRSQVGIPEPIMRAVLQSRSVSPRSSTSTGFRPPRPSDGVSSHWRMNSGCIPSAIRSRSRFNSLTRRIAGSLSGRPDSQPEMARTEKPVIRAKNSRVTPRLDRTSLTSRADEASFPVGSGSVDSGSAEPEAGTVSVVGRLGLRRDTASRAGDNDLDFRAGLVVAMENFSFLE